MITRQYFERNANADKNAEKILELIENKHMFNYSDVNKAEEISDEYFQEYLKTMDEETEKYLHNRGEKWKEISIKIERSIREYQLNIKQVDICLEGYIELNSKNVMDYIQTKHLDKVEEYLKKGYKFSNKEYIEIKDESERQQDFDRMQEVSLKYESMANKMSFNMYESVEELIYNMKLEEALKRIETGSPVDENCLRTFSKFSAGYLINKNERSFETNKDKLRTYYKLYYILNNKTKDIKQSKKSEEKTLALQIIPDKRYNAEELSLRINGTTVITDSDLKDVDENSIKKQIRYLIGIKESEALKIKIYDVDDYHVDVTINQAKYPTCFVRLKQGNRQVNKLDKLKEMEPFAKFKGEINDVFASAYVAKDELGNKYINYNPPTDQWQILPPFMYEMLKNNLHKFDLGSTDDSTEIRVEKLLEKNDFKAAWDLYEGMEENQTKDDVFTKITDAQDKKMYEEHHEEMKNMGSVLEGIYKNGEFSEEERSGMTPIGTLDNEPLYYNEENYKKYNNPDNDDSNSTKKKVNTFKELMEEEEKPKKRNRLGI